jgi:hypothetical protein
MPGEFSCRNEVTGSSVRNATERYENWSKLIMLSCRRD